MRNNIFQKKDLHRTNENTSTDEPKDNSSTDRSTNIIDLKNIAQIYYSKNTSNTVFGNLNLTIPDDPKAGQFITIMGKSGSGKSTILRYISGIQEPTRGDIYIYGEKRTDKRRIPMVFQQYTSFEWKTVLDNVALPLILKGVSKKEAREQAAEMIKIVGLEGHEKKWAKYPTLSGGQLQRVAIARNLIVNPQILLMDEPFGALDTVTRKQMQLFLRSLFESANIDPTVIFVTHSVNEAVFLSTDIYLLCSKPAIVKHQVKINLPNKRTNEVRYQNEYSQYVNKISSLMDEC